MRRKGYRVLGGFETLGGFSWDLSLAGTFGRRGFFQNFITKIDSSQNPPTVELQK
jgi:hypothetical protein